MNKKDQDENPNATARDNLMTGASLGYSGNYANTSLYNVGKTSNLWSTTVNNTSTSYRLNVNHDNVIAPQNISNKSDGFAVRFLHLH